MSYSTRQISNEHEISKLIGLILKRIQHFEKKYTDECKGQRDGNFFCLNLNK